MKFQPLLNIVWLATILGMAACAPHDEDNPHPLNASCQTGESCFSPEPQCTTDSSCKENFKCLDGKCTCQSDESCGDNMFCTKDGRCVPNTDPDEIIIRTEADYEKFKKYLKYNDFLYYYFFIDPEYKFDNDSHDTEKAIDLDAKAVYSLLERYVSSIRAVSPDDSPEVCKTRLELAHRVLVLRAMFSITSFPEYHENENTDSVSFWEKMDDIYWDCDVWNCLAQCDNPQGKLNLAIRLINGKCKKLVTDSNSDIEISELVDRYIWEAAEAGIKEARCIEHLDKDCPPKKAQDYLGRFNSGNRFASHPFTGHRLPSGHTISRYDYFTVHQSPEGEYHIQVHKSEPKTFWQRPINRHLGNISFNHLNISGMIDKRIIQKIFRQHLSELYTCFDGEIKNNKKFAKHYDATINVKITIDGSGSTTKVVKQSSTLKNNRLETCTLDSMRLWRYPVPKDKKPVTIDAQFVFSRDGDRNITE